MSTKSYLQHIYPAYATKEPLKFNPFKPSFYFDEEGHKKNHSKKHRPCRSTNLPFFQLTKWKYHELDLLRFYYRKALMYFNYHLWNAMGFNDDFITEEMILKEHTTYPYVEYEIADPKTPLSSRMLSQVRRQSLAMINSSKEKLAKLIKKRNWRIENNKPINFIQDNINSEIASFSLPQVPEKNNMEIDAKNAEIEISRGKNSDYILVIKSIWNTTTKRKMKKLHRDIIKNKNIKTYNNEISIPLNSHRYNNLLNNFSKFRANSFLIMSNNSVDVHYFFERPTWKFNRENRTLEASGDQGANKALVAVDSEGNEYFPSESKNNFCNLLKKKARLVPGSNNFSVMKRSIKNEINRIINELAVNMGFSRLKVFYLEDIRYINFGRYVGKFLKGFVHGQIRKKLQEICSLYGISLILSPSRYKSQRCSSCGFTHKNNRKSQSEFKCCHCGYEDNADANSCKNHLQRGLEPIFRSIIEARTNGFFWHENRRLVMCDVCV